MQPLDVTHGQARRRHDFRGLVRSFSGGLGDARGGLQLRQLRHIHPLASVVLVRVHHRCRANRLGNDDTLRTQVPKNEFNQHAHLHF
jgi:hypothetical protein